MRVDHVAALLTAIFLQIFVDSVSRRELVAGQDATSYRAASVHSFGAVRPTNRSSGRSSYSAGAGPAGVWRDSVKDSAAGDFHTPNEAEDCDASEWTDQLPPAQRGEGGFWVDWRAPAGVRHHQGAYGALEGTRQHVSPDGPWLLRSAIGRLTLAALVAAWVVFMALLIWSISSVLAPFAADWLTLPSDPAAGASTNTSASTASGA